MKRIKTYFILTFALYIVHCTLSIALAQKYDQHITIKRGDYKEFVFKHSGNVTASDITFVVKLTKSFSSPRLIQKANDDTTEISTIYISPYTYIRVKMLQSDTRDFTSAKYFYDIVADSTTIFDGELRVNQDVQTPFDGTTPPTSGVRFYVAGTFINTTVSDGSVFVWDSTNQTLSAISKDSLWQFLNVSDTLANASLTQAQKDSIGAIINDSSSVVYIKSFGAAGDGITDDADAINSALDYARSVGKPLVLENKEYYVTSSMDIANASIIGNNAIIRADLDGSSSTRVILSGVGTAGTTYELEEIAKSGDQFIKITNTTFLNSLQSGDLVLITSSKVFGDPVESAKQGEIHEIKDVFGWGLTFHDYLFDTYSLSDSPMIRKISAVTSHIKDLSIESIRQDSSERIIGINYLYAKNPIVENVTIKNTFMKGLSFDACYAPVAKNMNIVNVPGAGFGYGINVLQSSMYAKITDITITGGRHCVSLVGGSLGVPYDAVFTNVTGTIGIQGVDAAVFDAHESVGSVSFINCRAYGGLRWIDYDTPAYSAEISYNLNDWVYSEEGYIYQSLSNLNQGNELTDLTKWTPVTGNNSVGFDLRAYRYRNINCEAHNTRYGIQGASSATYMESVHIENFKAYNCDYPLYNQVVSTGSFYLNGFYSFRDRLTSNYGIEITTPTKHLTLENIEVFNSRGIKLRTPATNDSTIYEITNFKSSMDRTVTGSIGMEIYSKNIKMTNITLRDYDSPIYLNWINNAEINITASNYMNYIIRTVDSTGNIVVTGYAMNGRGDTYIIYARDDIASVLIPHFMFDGKQEANALLGRSGYRLGTLNVGNISTSGLFGSFAEGFTGFDYIITGGIQGKLADYVVTASPEGALIARVGSFARDILNGKIYLKTSGTGNTGWQELSLASP